MRNDKVFVPGVTYLVKSGVAPDGLGRVDVDDEDGGEDDVDTGHSHDAGPLAPSLNIADTNNRILHSYSEKKLYFMMSSYWGQLL